MDAEVDLRAASRAGLMAIIAEQKSVIDGQRAIISEQQALVAELQRRVEELEARLSGDGQPRGMSGNKPASHPRPTGDKKPRKPRPQGFGRRRMEHAVETCPDCGTHLVGGWVHRTREVIEIPESAVRVTEHVVIGRRCPGCGKRRLPKLELGGVAMGRQRLGINLVSLVVTLRERARLPIGTIRWYLRTVHGLELSAGAIVGVIHRAAEAARRPVGEILERIRGSPVVFADETGWRQNGANGFVWTFGTSGERYFARRNRGG